MSGSCNSLSSWLIWLSIRKSGTLQALRCLTRLGQLYCSLTPTVACLVFCLNPIKVSNDTHRFLMCTLIMGSSQKWWWASETDILPIVPPSCWQFQARTCDACFLLGWLCQLWGMSHIITSDVISKYFQVPWDLRPRIDPFRASKKRLASLLRAKVTLSHGAKKTSKWMSTAFISISNVWFQHIAGLPLLEIDRKSTVQGRNPSPHFPSPSFNIKSLGALMLTSKLSKSVGIRSWAPQNLDAGFKYCIFFEFF